MKYLLQFYYSLRADLDAVEVESLAVVLAANADVLYDNRNEYAVEQKYYHQSSKQNIVPPHAVPYSEHEVAYLRAERVQGSKLRRTLMFNVEECPDKREQQHNEHQDAGSCSRQIAKSSHPNEHKRNEQEHQPYNELRECIQGSEPQLPHWLLSLLLIVLRVIWL